MKSRRAFLRALPASALAFLGGCLGAAPRGTGPRRPPDPPAGQPRQTPNRPDLYVERFDFEAAEDGSLRVFGEVGNRGGAERVATVRVRVRKGEETYTRETTVTVQPGATASFAVTFDITEESFLRGGELDVTLV